MLQLDIAGIMNDRQIPNYYTFLCQNGFAPYTASRLLNNKMKSISHTHLTKLCLLLHCTPNDLYIWNSPDTIKINHNQPVHRLLPVIKKPLITSKLQYLPLEKLREIKQAIEEVMKTI